MTSFTSLIYEFTKSPINVFTLLILIFYTLFRIYQGTMIRLQALGKKLLRFTLPIFIFLGLTPPTIRNVIPTYVTPYCRLILCSTSSSLQLLTSPLLSNFHNFKASSITHSPRLHTSPNSQPSLEMVIMYAITASVIGALIGLMLAYVLVGFLYTAKYTLLKLYGGCSEKLNRHPLITHQTLRHSQ